MWRGDIWINRLNLNRSNAHFKKSISLTSFSSTLFWFNSKSAGISFAKKRSTSSSPKTSELISLLVWHTGGWLRLGDPMECLNLIGRCTFLKEKWLILASRNAALFSGWISGSSSTSPSSATISSSTTITLCYDLPSENVFLDSAFLGLLIN